MLKKVLLYLWTRTLCVGVHYIKSAFFWIYCAAFMNSRLLILHLSFRHFCFKTSRYTFDTKISAIHQPWHFVACLSLSRCCSCN